VRGAVAVAGEILIACDRALRLVAPDDRRAHLELTAVCELPLELRGAGGKIGPEIFGVADGERLALTPGKPIKVFGYPGMPVMVKAGATTAALPITAGQPVAELELTAGEATEKIALVASRAVEAPGLGWRLARRPW